MPAFAPLPSSILHTLAPSSPLPSTFSANTHALAARLSRTDAPRRKSGVLHHAPQGLGLPDLVSTGVQGDWEGRRPPWVDAERGDQSEEGEEKLEEEEAWRELGVAGIPKDMDEWEDRERVKRDWREKRRQTAEQVKLAEHVTKRLEIALDASTTDSRRQKSTASASTLSSISRPSQPTLLTSHFSSSKASAPPFASGQKPSPAPPPAGNSSKKKRPPSSPPPLPHPPPPQPRYDRRSSSPRGPDAPAPTGQSGDSERSGKASFPSLSSINSAGRAAEVEAGSSRAPDYVHGTDEKKGRRELSGEDEEILFEGGCTQMVLPDPTPSARPAALTDALPRPPQLIARSEQIQPPPWSSPGLRGDLDDSGGKSSTPVPAAPPPPLPRQRASTSSRSSRSPSPPLQPIPDLPPRPAPPSRAPTAFSTTTTSSLTNNQVQPFPQHARPTLARLSELARQGSSLSVRSNGSDVGEGMSYGEIERFLEDEARE